MRVLFWMFVGFDHHTTSEHLLVSVIERLCENGHTVHILQKNSGGTHPSIPEPLSRYNVTTELIPFKTVDKRNFVARYYNELRYVKSCKKHFSANYDAVFIQSNNVAGFAVREVKKKIPNAIVTFNVQDIFPYNASYSESKKKNGLAFKILAGIQRYGYSHSDHIITISEDMKDTLVTDGVDEDKVEVIYNWSYQDNLFVDIDCASVSDMFSPTYNNIVYAGNIGVMQNVDIIVEAAKLMSGDDSVWFHIIGDGVYKNKLEAKANECRIRNISFWPMQLPELAPAVYSSADVNIIPLVKDVFRTALPSKTATCLACQKPIIFAIGKESRFGRKVAEEAGCLIVEADNAESLVMAIQKVICEGRKNNEGPFFLKYCNNTKNSGQYAEIIVRQSV